MITGELKKELTAYGRFFGPVVLQIHWMYCATAEHEHEAKRNANGLCE